MAFELFKLYKSFLSSKPGSLMIMGEHAVLHGQPAIVAAINKFLNVELRVFHIDSITNLSNNSVDIEKSKVQIKTWLPDAIVHKFDLEQVTNHPQLEYVLNVIDYFKEDLSKHHFHYDFVIKSDINHTMGLGSSAAVTIAMIETLVDFIADINSQERMSDIEILKIGRMIVTKIQGAGSGADLAASLYGGVLWYEMQNTKVEKIADNLPIVAVYCGYKLSTKKVIAKISASNIEPAKHTIYQQIFKLIGLLTVDAKTCIINKDWKGLGQLFNLHYGLQEALELSDTNIAQLIYALRANSNISGAKISGSGLGDCIIGILNSVTTDIDLVDVLL